MGMLRLEHLFLRIWFPLNFSDISCNMDLFVFHKRKTIQIARYHDLAMVISKNQVSCHNTLNNTFSHKNKKPHSQNSYALYKMIVQEMVVKKNILTNSFVRVDARAFVTVSKNSNLPHSQLQFMRHYYESVTHLKNCCPIVER